MTLSEASLIASDLCKAKGWGTARYIDSGASGAVFEIDHPQQGKLALKVYDPAFFLGENAAIEVARIQLQSELRGHGHPNLIEICEVGEYSEKKTWYQTMEFCPWPNLEKSLPDISDEIVEQLIRQLAAAVLFLDEKGLVHRDIKPANIVVSPCGGHLKLLDLGVLRRVEAPSGNGTDEPRTKKRFVATAQYSPHEYVSRNELPGRDGFDALNVYQIGAVLHDLIMKRPLFGEEAASGNRYFLYEALKNKKPPVFNVNVAPRLIALCKDALDKDPVRRVSRVKVSDFLQPAEEPDAMRRRIAARAASMARETAPSLAVWKAQVWDWLAAAARRERETLRRHRIQERPSAGRIEWDLLFSDVDLSVVAALATGSDGQLTLSLAIARPSPIHLSVLQISSSGTDIDQSEVVAYLASQLIYLLDLSAQPEDVASARVEEGADA